MSLECFTSSMFKGSGVLNRILEQLGTEPGPRLRRASFEVLA